MGILKRFAGEIPVHGPVSGPASRPLLGPASGTLGVYNISELRVRLCADTGKPTQLSHSKSSLRVHLRCASWAGPNHALPIASDFSLETSHSQRFSTMGLLICAIFILEVSQLLMI